MKKLFFLILISILTYGCKSDDSQKPDQQQADNSFSISHVDGGLNEVQWCFYDTGKLVEPSKVPAVYKC